MRWRTGFVWALAGVVTLAILLVLAGHPALTAGAQAGMSAPQVPAVSVESASAARLPQSQFDWHAFNARPLSFSFVAVAIFAADRARHRGTASPHYGPLHRRPPPSFS
jgi:hypothetical protein